MKFLIDQGVLHAEEAFSTLGEVQLEAGNHITSEKVKNIDVLVLRTTTKVNQALLKNSTVKFVATATSGSDHIDKEYLATEGIGFAAAPGCNAEAVAEFVVNALLRLSERIGFDIEKKTLGIIGAGHTGSALEKKAGILGIKCLLNDPPLYDETKDSRYLPLAEVISQSDLISLHVPITKSGRHPTHHLINPSVIKHFRNGTILVNGCRGGVIQESVIHTNRSLFAGLVVDVWENEPAIDAKTLHMADIATPHVAGYSLEGKIKATEMAYHHVCRFFNLEPTWKSPRRRSYDKQEIELKSTDKRSILPEIMSKVYDIFDDDRMLRSIYEQEKPESYFRSLRNSYNYRREFSTFEVRFADAVQADVIEQIRNLGFTVV